MQLLIDGIIAPKIRPSCLLAGLHSLPPAAPMATARTSHGGGDIMPVRQSLDWPKRDLIMFSVEALSGSLGEAGAALAGAAESAKRGPEAYPA